MYISQHFTSQPNIGALKNKFDFSNKGRYLLIFLLFLIFE